MCISCTYPNTFSILRNLYSEALETVSINRSVVWPDTVHGGISIRVDKTRYCSDYIDISHKMKNFGIYSIWQNYIT